jgi:signal peptidase I
MSTETSHVRKPWIATSLSKLCTGLGQIYCGQVRRGLVMYCGSLLLGPLIFVTATFASSTPMLVAFFTSLAALAGLVIWSARDAGAIARRMIGTEFEPRDFNSPIVYSIMSLTNLTYAAGLVFVLRATVIEAFVIPSASMSPTFVPGDRILVTKLGMNSATFERGDLVVYRNPNNRKQNYVKRIIGLPGETVEIRDGTVIIDGQPLKQTPVAPANDDAEQKPGNGGQTFMEHAGDRQYSIHLDKPDVPVQAPSVKVAADAYYVLGDHRDKSLDSREVGNIPHGLMIGIVRCIYYPANSWRRFGVPK